MKKIVEFDGLLVNLSRVDFIGTSGFKRAGDTGSYGFEVIINGSKARIGDVASKPEAELLRSKFKEMVLGTLEGNNS